MKEIKKEIQKVEYVTKYEAIDGTIFDSYEECKKYDNSARAILLSRYQPLVLDRYTEEDLFNMGSCEYSMDIVKMENESHIELILQLVALFNPHLKNEDINKNRDVLTKILKNKDILFIGRGCDYENYDAFWIFNSLTGFINDLVKKCDPGSIVEIKDDLTYPDKE